MATSARGRRSAFTLLELLLALVIMGTALVALSAAQTGGISTAGESIGQRAAREACRAKLEALAAGTDAVEGGAVEGKEAFTFSSTREERTVGAADTPDEKYVVLTVTVSYPSDQATEKPGVPRGQASVTLSTLLSPPEVLERQRGGKPK